MDFPHRRLSTVCNRTSSERLPARDARGLQADSCVELRAEHVGISVAGQAAAIMLDVWTACKELGCVITEAEVLLMEWIMEAEPPEPNLM